MRFDLLATQSRLINGPIYKLMLNCPAQQATVQFDNGVPETVNGKQSFICAPERPWKTIIVTLANAGFLSPCSVWYTNIPEESLPIVEPGVSSQGGIFVSQTVSAGTLVGAVQVLAASTKLLDFDNVVPAAQGRCLVQNMGPADIEIAFGAVAVGAGLIIPANGGLLSVNCSTELYARTVDGSAQVAPADTRIIVEYVR